MTELKAERELARADVAAYLREFADELDGESSEHDRIGDHHSSEYDRTADHHDDEHDRTADHHDDEGSIPEDGRVTFLVGNDSATINPPETVRFEVEVDSDSSLMGDEKAESVEFEISWSADAVEETDDFLIG